METETKSGGMSITLFRFGEIPVEARVPCCCKECSTYAVRFVIFDTANVRGNLCLSHFNQLIKEEEHYFAHFTELFWDALFQRKPDCGFKLRPTLDICTVQERYPALSLRSNK